MAAQVVKFVVSENYDFTKSSEENYRASEAQFVGKYKKQRLQLDYSYHSYYTIDRQLLHDQIIDLFHQTVVRDDKNNLVCEAPLENWIVFTAGPMGAGKGHTVQWLYQEGILPLEAFVNVDPDSIRALLPETDGYNKVDETRTGFLTQREVGYITEVLTFEALDEGKNVLVDSSLRDAEWFLQYFDFLREKFPRLKIAILNVNAKVESILERARRRATVTGRVVPEHVIHDAISKVPHSMQVLSPRADFFAHIRNEDGEPPYTEYCELKANRGQTTIWSLERLDVDKYLYKRYDEGPEVVEDIIDCWRQVFADVWIMQCAIPPRQTSSPSSRTASILLTNSLDNVYYYFQSNGLKMEEGSTDRESISASSDAITTATLITEKTPPEENS